MRIFVPNISVLAMVLVSARRLQTQLLICSFLGWLYCCSGWFCAV